MAHTICHVEFGAVDVKKTADFYRSVFGWKFDSSMGEEYLTFKAGQDIGGGLYKTKEAKPGGGMLFYVLVDDIDATMHKITESGGRQKMAKAEIPNVGWYAHFSDPAGNVMGLFTPKKQPAAAPAGHQREK